MNARLEAASPDTAALSADQQIGQIAVQRPGAPAVFHRLKLDFCRGGHAPLATAAAEQGLDVNAVLSELAALQRPSARAPVSEPAALIDHILTRYHDVHRAQLPELIRMAHRVKAVHRASPDVPAGLGDLLEEIQQEMLSHMKKEETILFPMLKAGGYPPVSQPVAMMRAEHVDHGVALDQLNTLTHDARPPTGACTTWRALYAGIAHFSDDLINHIHLENNVLFPQFEPAPQAAPVARRGCGCN